MLKKLIPIIAMALLILGVQAEESQEKQKCPDDPSEFKGKEDDCFDCLAGALDKLKLFTTEANKMLEERKLSSAEEAESMKTRSEGLWESVEGWEKICEPNPKSKETPKTETESKPKEETKAEIETEAESTSEAESTTEAEAETEAETEAEPKAGPGTEEAEEKPEPEAETETEMKPET